MAEPEKYGSLVDQYQDLDYRDPELEALRNEYGAYERPQQQEPDDYGWGITAAFARGFERLRAMPDIAQGDYEELAGHYESMEESALSQEDQARFEEIRNTPGFWAKAGELIEDPRLIFQTVAESLPMMAAPIAGALGGGIAGGAAGTAMGLAPGAVGGTVAGSILGGAAGSYLTEYMNAIGEYFSKNRVDMKNPAQLKAAFENPELMAGARDWAHDRGVPIAIFDGLSMGLAGRIAKPVADLTRKVAGRSLGLGGATEIGMQAGFGMAGEAGAQINTEGRITDELDVLLEGFGEIVPGFAEAGVSKYLDARAGRNAPPPDDSPLVALDQADPVLYNEIPETDIDPETGKPVDRMAQLGDQLYDDLGEEGPNTPPPDELDILLTELGTQLSDDLAAQENKLGREKWEQSTKEAEIDAAFEQRNNTLEAARTADEARPTETVEAQLEAARERVISQVNAARAQADPPVPPISEEELADPEFMKMIDRVAYQYVQKSRSEIDEQTIQGQEVDQIVAEDQAGPAESSSLTAPEFEQIPGDTRTPDQRNPQSPNYIPPTGGETVTTEGRPIEGEPIDVAGGQPTEEGMILPEGVNPAGGRPLNTALADALRKAGIYVPDDEDPPAPPAPPGGGGTPAAPQRGSDVARPEAEQEAAAGLRADAEVAEANRILREASQETIEKEADAEAKAEREAIQTEEDRPVEPEPTYDDIPFEPLTPAAPEEVKPEVEWADERLATEEGRSTLDVMMQDVQPRGGSTLIPDTDDGRIAPGEATAFTGRTPSTNPPWFQSMIAEGGIASGKGMKYVQNAVDKAKKGQRLGKQQKRVIQAMLDEHDEQNARYEPPGEALPFELEQEQDGVVPEAPAAPAEPRQEVDADIGVPGDLFSTGANQQVDLVDEARADARAKGEVPAGMKLRESKPSELNDLATETEGLIEKYIEQGETDGGMDQTAIVGAIQKLKLNKHPRAADLEQIARDAIEGRGTTPPSKKALIEEFETKIKAAYRANELAGKAWQRKTKNQPQREAERDAAVQEVLDMVEAIGETQAKEIVIRMHSEHIADKKTGWGMPDGFVRPFGFVKTKPVADTPVGEVFETFGFSGTEEYEVVARNEEHGVALVLSKATDFEQRQEGGKAYGAYVLFPMNQRESDSSGWGTFIASEDERRPADIPKRPAKGEAVYSSQVFMTREEAIAEFNERMGERSDTAVEIDEANFEREGPDTEERVFNSTVDPKKRKGIDIRLKNEGNKFISPKEADKIVQSWEDHAIAQRDQKEKGGPQDYKDNSNRVIISLFDTTGTWANPYALAGYDVRALDIKDGIDITDFSTQFMDEMFNNFEGKEIYGILAACPCTTFSNSSTKWRRNDLPADHPQNRHENADPVQSRIWIEKMWGKEAAEAKDPETGEYTYATAHDYAIALVNKTMQTLEYLRPKFWALENPEGRIESAAGLPGPWRTGFQPHNFGEPYTKRTLLWGEFNEDLPTANVEPTEGSKMHLLSPSDNRQAERSETPEGFSYAFFMANNFLDKSPVERTMEDYWYIAGAVEEAFKAGVTEDQIRSYLYVEEDYEGGTSESIEEAKATLRELIAEVQGGPPATPGEYSPATFAPPPQTPRGIGYQHKTEIMSKSYAELAKRDKTDLQSFAIRLGLDDTGTKMDLARRVKDFVASTPAAQEAALGIAPTAEEVVPGNTLQMAGQTVRLQDRPDLKDKNAVYGEIARTKGVDGDPVDVFVSKKADKDWVGDVYVIDQYIDNVFDEHKVMLGYNNLIDARRSYRKAYNKDWTKDGVITKMTLKEFNSWIKERSNNPAALSSVTEAGRKRREKAGKSLKYSIGKELHNAPTNEWIKTVLEGGENKMGDVPDTVPLNIAVSELLNMQQQIQTGAPTRPAASASPATPATPDVAQIEAAIKPLNERMPGAPTTVLANYRQAPTAIVEEMQANGMERAKAVFDPNTNQIYLFADRMGTVDEAQRAALHEKTHRGLREAFGTDLDSILDDIYANATEAMKAKMTELTGRYKLDPNNRADQRVMAEELIADMAENDVKSGVLKRVVAAIRSLLRKMGFVQKFTDNDIHAMIREAQGAVSRTRDNVAGIMIEEEVVVEGTEEVYVVEQDAQQLLTGVDQRVEVCRKLRNCL